MVDLEDFTPLVGDSFVADFGEDGTVTLTLTEAEPRPTGNDHDRAFALLFRGPLERVFEQGTVPLVHDDLGSLDIFLVPVAEHADGRLYEAVFTRAVE